MNKVDITAQTVDADRLLNRYYPVNTVSGLSLKPSLKSFSAWLVSVGGLLTLAFVFVSTLLVAQSTEARVSDMLSQHTGSSISREPHTAKNIDWQGGNDLGAGEFRLGASYSDLQTTLDDRQLFETDCVADKQALSGKGRLAFVIRCQSVVSGSLALSGLPVQKIRSVFLDNSLVHLTMTFRMKDKLTLRQAMVERFSISCPGQSELNIVTDGINRHEVALSTTAEGTLALIFIDGRLRAVWPQIFDIGQ